MLSYQGAWWLSAGIATTRLPHSAHPTIAPFQFFSTADGYIAIACAKEKFFRALVEAVDLSELADDARFTSFAKRHVHREALLAALANRISERTTDEWLERLRGRVPVAPVREFTDLLDPEILAARGMLAAYTQPALGDVRAVGSPLRVSGYIPDYRPAPTLGADTRDLLAELGFAAAEVDDLMEAGAFGAT
jgi:crotonobetainyl-CoA:carnitine CoA-transferase CaiB-like acyl-CoA transferase